MRIALVRTRVESAVFEGAELVGDRPDPAVLEALNISDKDASSSKNIVRGLQRRGLVESCEEWKFWGGPPTLITPPGMLPVRLFPADETLFTQALAAHVASGGAPDVLWAEGRKDPVYLQRIHEACGDSFKLIYSKHWQPWKIVGLERYDLCLVDEAWQIDELARTHPGVHAGIWDKLIDYEVTHRPLGAHKEFDVCYVAYLRPRKQHDMLFEALAKLGDRKLRCVCVGGDRDGYQADLERLAADLGLDVTFTGELNKDEVNAVVDRSRMSVICARKDGMPRALLESLAADVPVLVNDQLMAGKRVLSASSGRARLPEEFHLGIAEILDNLDDFSAREQLLERFSEQGTIDRFVDILRQAGAPVPAEGTHPATA